MIKIPSIYFGSSIKRESVKLELYITGTLAGRLEDVNGSGELRETYPTSSYNKIAGTVLYNHGILLLSGNWDVCDTLDYYETEEDVDNNGNHLGTYSWKKNRFRWIFFGTGYNQRLK